MTQPVPSAPASPIPQMPSGPEHAWKGSMESFLDALPLNAKGEPEARRAYEALREAAIQNLAAARLLARTKAPYFRPLLFTLVPRETPLLGTIATTRQAVLMYDPQEIAKWSPKELAGGLIHECLHLLNKHFERCGRRDGARYNRAGDRAINPGVYEIGLSLPSGALMPKDLGMKDGLTADEYYAAEKEEPEKEGGVGAGHCGSCANGQHDPNEPSDDAAEGSGGRSDAAVARATRATSEAMLDAEAKGQGRLPAGWKRIAEEATKPPQVNWRKELAHACRAAVAFRAGGVVHRFDSPSRRQAGIGYGSGKPLLARTREPIARVALVVDTSGSQGSKEMGLSLREGHAVVKSLGVDVTFAVADATIHGLKPVRTIEEMGSMLAGGGGTDFCPAFEALDKQKPRPDVIVYFTDGMGRAPVLPPPGITVVWALVGPYVVAPAKWGKVIRIKMEPDDEDEDIEVHESHW